MYFGVPLSNFAGWLDRRMGDVGGYLALTGAARSPAAAPGLGVGLYYGVLLFNLAVTCVDRRDGRSWRWESCFTSATFLLL